MSLSMEALRALFKERNVEPFSFCVRSGEHSKDVAFSDRAYYTIFGGELINDLSRHPRIAKMSPWGWTSAAGAYQAMCAVTGKVETDTWGDFCRAMGETVDTMPFDKDAQDCFYVWCLRRRHALDDVMRGDLDTAMLKCSYEWASLPPGRYGQPTTTMDKLRAVFIDRGGLLATDNLIQPAAPIEERDLSAIPPRAAEPEEQAMPDESSSVDWSSALKLGGAIASFFNPIIGVAITSLGGVVEQKIEKTISKHTDPATAKTVAGQLTTVIQDSLTKVTGKADPVAAVAEIRANPAAATAVAAAVEQKLIDMTPLLNEMHRQAQERFAAEAADRNAASDRVAKVGWNIQKWLVAGGLVITGAIVVALLALLIVQVSTAPDHLPDATLIAFAGPLLVLGMQGLREAYAFAFGGTQEGSPAAIAKGARS